MKFEDLQKVDIIDRLMGDFNSGLVTMVDGKIVYEYKALSPSTPWYFHVIERERECTKWIKIYFEKFHILPKNCFGCWKIVCRPKNLDALFELNKLQEEMELPSKCGVDIRQTETYKGIYLGFWYCPLGDLKGARELYKEVKRKVRGALSLDTPVILKRGCTEMENAFGPSNLWQYTPDMRLMEDLLEPSIVIDELKPEQPAFAKLHVTAFWIHYAHRMGDPTAKKYIRNYPWSMGSVPTVTYHDVLPEIKEEVVGHEIGIQRLPKD